MLSRLTETQAQERPRGLSDMLQEQSRASNKAANTIYRLFVKLQTSLQTEDRHRVITRLIVL